MGINPGTVPDTGVQETWALLRVWLSKETALYTNHKRSPPGEECIAPGEEMMQV